jgi:hypothetical protein
MGRLLTASWLRRRNVLTLGKYESVGGATGILRSYISDEIKRSAHEQTARLVLRLMCAPGGEAKSPVDIGLEEIVRAIGERDTVVAPSDGSAERIKRILEEFIRARILIRTRDGKYNLTHDYLAPYIRLATEGAETKVEKANWLLKRYLADFREDPKTTVPFRHVREIRKYASPDLKEGVKARELLGKSMRAFYREIGAILAFPIALLVFYFVIADFYYLWYDANSKEVLVVQGHPNIVLPGLNRIVIRSDSVSNELSPKSADDISYGRVTGLLWPQWGNGEFKTWEQQTIVRLLPTSQARIWRWLGKPERATLSMTRVITDSGIDISIRTNAIDALGQLAQIYPQVLTQTVSSLTTIISDSTADSSLRSDSMDVLRQLADTNPEIITPETTRAITILVKDSKAEPSLRGPAINALTQFSGIAPQIVTSEVISTVGFIFTDPKTDSSIRRNGESITDQIARANPQAATPGDVQNLFETAINPRTTIEIRQIAVEAIAKFALHSLKSEMIEPLIAIAESATIDPSTRGSALDALGQLASSSPKRVTPAMIRAMTAFVIAANRQRIDYIFATTDVLHECRWEPTTDMLHSCRSRMTLES